MKIKKFLSSLMILAVILSTVACSQSNQSSTDAVNQTTPTVTQSAEIITPEITQETEAPNTENKEVTVYITKSGAKYHSDGCRYLSKSKIPISLEDALSRGYSPCSKCNPPQ